MRLLRRGDGPWRHRRAVGLRSAARRFHRDFDGRRTSLVLCQVTHRQRSDGRRTTEDSRRYHIRGRDEY